MLGVAVAFLLMRFRLLNDMLTPLAIALNAIPIFVLVAVFNNMFAITSEIPRRLMVTLVVYFIVLVNVAKGLRQVEPTHLELLRSYAASPSQVLRKARIPNAVPYLFTALRIAAPTAVITAFVAEYFGGTQNGLGYPHHVEHDREHRGGMGLRARAPACSGWCSTWSPWPLESITTHQQGRQPRGRNHMRNAHEDRRPQASALALVAAACGGDDDDDACGDDATRRATDAPATTAARHDGAATTDGRHGRHRRRPRHGRTDGGGAAGRVRDADSIKLQLQWLTQAQFGGYYAAIDQGFYEDMCLDVELIETGVDIVPQQVLADGEVDFAIAWVPKALPTREQGADIVEHRPDLPALGHAAGVVQGRRHHHAGGLRRQERSATGASATSTRSSPRSARPASTRRPTSASCSSSSTCSAC